MTRRAPVASATPLSVLAALTAGMLEAIEGVTPEILAKLRDSGIMALEDLATGRASSTALPSRSIRRRRSSCAPADIARRPLPGGYLQRWNQRAIGIAQDLAEKNGGYLMVPNSMTLLGWCERHHAILRATRAAITLRRV